MCCALSASLTFVVLRVLRVDECHVAVAERVVVAAVRVAVLLLLEVLRVRVGGLHVELHQQRRAAVRVIEEQRTSEGRGGVAAARSAPHFTG